MAAVVDTDRVDAIGKFIDIGRQEGAEIFQIEVPELKDGCFYPPTLVTNVQTTSTLVQQEIFGPVAVVQTFRTPKEVRAESVHAEVSASI
jgi:aldehyde dehydrogenase (NAD+)